MQVEPLQERDFDALDYSLAALDSLVVGYGQLLHTRWVYSYPARFGGDSDFDPAHPRPKPGALSK